MKRDVDLAVLYQPEREVRDGNVCITSHETTKQPVATTVSRSSSRKSLTSLDQSAHHPKTPSTKAKESVAASSHLSIATTQHASALDLLLQTPRPKLPRSLQNSRGNHSLPNLHSLASRSMERSSTVLGVESQKNAVWDLDEAKEKAKTRSRMLKKAFGSQSFSNLEEIELIRSQQTVPSWKEPPMIRVT